jgi:hypothetical protein
MVKEGMHMRLLREWALPLVALTAWWFGLIWALASFL